jgi:hypothetical protein
LDAASFHRRREGNQGIWPTLSQPMHPTIAPLAMMPGATAPRDGRGAIAGMVTIRFKVYSYLSDHNS